MVDEFQIPATRTGSIKIQHDESNNLLYVPSSVEKQVVFGPDLVEISDISIGKLIVNGVANHASKAY